MLLEHKGHNDLRDWGFLFCLTKVRGAIKTGLLSSKLIVMEKLKVLGIRSRF